MKKQKTYKIEWTDFCYQKAFNEIQAITRARKKGKIPADKMVSINKE